MPPRPTRSLREAIEWILHPDSAGELSLVVAHSPGVIVCADHVEGALARSRGGSTRLRGAVTEEVFVANVLRAAERPIVIADPSPDLWDLLSDHRSRILRSAPCAILLPPAHLMGRAAAHVQTLAGANVFHVDGTGFESEWERDLREVLARLYPRPQDAERIVADAGVDRTAVDLSGPPRSFWMSVVTVAREGNRLEDLVLVALSDYPQRQELLVLQMEMPPLLKR